jgi:hypothetical protein
MSPHTEPHSPTTTLTEAGAPTTKPTAALAPVLSKYRKLALIGVFSLAQFMDAFNNSALFPAVPAISEALSIKTNESTWLFAAYQATFAAFLLIVCLSVA